MSNGSQARSASPARSNVPSATSATAVGNMTFASGMAITRVAADANGGRDVSWASIGNRQVRFNEVAAEDNPAVQPVNGLPAAGSEFLPEPRVLDHRAHGRGKILGIVTNQNVLAIDCLETFTADRGRDDRLPHRP